MGATAVWTFLPVSRKDGEVLFTLLDAEDYVVQAGKPWRILKKRGQCYVQDGITGERYLHREILGLDPESPLRTDHINGDTLDNRRMNLRAVTNGQNLQNRHGLNSNNQSGYRGVSFDSQTGRWRACVALDGRTQSLGRFDSPEEADEVATAYRAEHMPYSEMDRG